MKIHVRYASLVLFSALVGFCCSRGAELPAGVEEGKGKDISVVVEVLDAASSKDEETPDKASSPEPVLESGTVERADDESVPFVASRSSRVFHRRDCALAKKIKPDNLVEFKDRKAALGTGRRPCKVCAP